MNNQPSGQRLFCYVNLTKGHLSMEKAEKTGKIQNIFIAVLFAIMLLLIFACGMTIYSKGITL